MLREIKHVRQIPGEPARRWFMSHTMDLIVWYGGGRADNADSAGGGDGAADVVLGFQFCYDKNRSERALTWRLASGLSHMRVDDGEGGWGKSTPLLVADARFDRARTGKLFAANCQFVPAAVAELVLAKINEYAP